MKNLNFSQALEAIKDGHDVKRRHTSLVITMEKGVFAFPNESPRLPVSHTVETDVNVISILRIPVRFYEPVHQGVNTRIPNLCSFDTLQKVFCHAWVPTQEDLFATDWMVCVKEQQQDSCNGTPMATMNAGMGICGLSFHGEELKSNK